MKNAMRQFESISLEQAREHERKHDEMQALYEGADDLGDHDRAMQLRLIEQSRMSYYAGLAALSPFRIVD